MKTIEEKYKKLDSISHVLARPGRYIGSVNPHTAITYIVDGDTFEKKEITYTPALLKIFDEVISNSIDFSKKEEGKHLNTIKVDVNRETGEFSVYDNGGIPVVIHQEHQQWLPEMLFELMSGSNFDDTEDSISTGQNGEGVSLNLIFSTEFHVHTSDGKNQFKQSHFENSRKKTVPEVRPSSKNFTKITWIPDYPRLNLEKLDNDNYERIIKRVYDVAGCNPQLKVYLNGNHIKINSFKDYVDLYDGVNVVDDTENWKVAIASAKEGFEHISFVNSTETFVGGTHIDYITNQIVNKLREHFKKKHKIEVKPSDIKNHLQLFINATIIRPRYSSQTKEQLITESKAYQTSWECSDKFIKKVIELEAIQNILDWVKAKEQANLNAELRKHNKSLKSDPKDVAKFHDATSKNRAETSLLIVEGDSALSGVLSGRDTKLHGAYPLKGKPINAYDMDIKDVMEKDEFSNLLTILGLQLGVKVKSVDELRFGKIVITTDQDLDGFSIRGLLLNNFYKYFPELYEFGVIHILNTPIVKVTYKKKKISFYSIEEFELWKSEHLNENFNVKYYKGLGTSNSTEWREYFSNELWEQNIVRVEINSEEDVAMFKLLFSKEKGMTNKRKEWMQIGDNATILEDYVRDTLFQSDNVQPKNLRLTKNVIGLKEFFETQFKAYTIYDSKRSIANIIDGQKITQRKVLHTCSIRSNTDIKVAQLCSQVAYETAFHHGEVGIGGVICNLAQSFAGANNMNLLEPVGQFGSRLSPIPAAHRYIFTKLTDNYRLLFKKDDELALKYLYDDEQRIEPEYYLPILPVILINGSQGIGTGFASKVLSYNPKDIKSDIINILKNKKRKPLIPWYNGFTGDITNGENPNQWSIRGKLEVNEENIKGKTTRKTNDKTYSVKITELPIGYYLDDIKSTLNKLKAKGIVKDYDDNSTEESFNIDVLLQRDDNSLTESSIEKLYDTFKLVSKDTENLTLWNTNEKLQVFNNASHIVEYFTNFRLIKYEDRRLALINQVQTEINDLSEKIRFITFYLKNYKLFRNTGKTELYDLLTKNNFINPDTLLAMSINNLTLDAITRLELNLVNKNTYLDSLKITDAKSMYLKELEELKL